MIGWRYGIYAAWLDGSRLGPWPLWKWGTRIGWAFDVGHLRVGVRWRKGPE